MNYKELLPKSWEDVNLKTFQRILNQQYDFELSTEHPDYYLQELDNALITVATILDINADDLRQMDMNESMKLVDAVSWISTPPVASKKRPDYLINDLDVSFDNMLTYSAIEKQAMTLDNVQLVIDFFIKKPSPIKRSYKNLWRFWISDPKPIKSEDLNVIEIYTLFFFAQKLLIKSLKTIRLQQTIQLQVALWKQKLVTT